MLSTILAALTIFANPDDDAITWQKDYKTAIAEAAKLDRPLLIYSGRDTCPNSQVMDYQVIPSETVRPLLARNFVCLRVDADRPSPDVEKHLLRVKGDILPFCVYLKADGSYFGSTSGYRGADAFRADLDYVLTHAAAKKEDKDSPKEAPPKPYEPEPIPDNEIDGRFILARLQIAQEHVKRGRKAKAVEMLEDLVVGFPKSPMLPEVKKYLEEVKKK
jgi:thioredoxin-related protein